MPFGEPAHADGQGHQGTHQLHPPHEQPPVDAVGERTRVGPEHHDRNELRRGGETDPRGRTRDLEEHERNGQRLEPSTGVGEEGAGQEDDEPAVPQRFEHGVLVLSSGTGPE
nr:hypothetical protein [Rhodococcus rhodochrous]